MWFKLFSIMGAMAELGVLLMAPKKSISAILAIAMRLAGIAAPESNLPTEKIMAGAAWVERAKADGVITADEIAELGMLLDVKIEVPGGIVEGTL